MIEPKTATVTTAIAMKSSVVRPPPVPVVVVTVRRREVVTVVTEAVEETVGTGPVAARPSPPRRSTRLAASALRAGPAQRARTAATKPLSRAPPPMHVSWQANISRAPGAVDCAAVPPKQRQIRIEQRLTPDVMEQMQSRTDEQLENERKYRSIAYSILGARAAERYDPKTARAWFEKAMVASTHPQERIQIRRMSDASMALAERRAGDLKVAVERLGQEAPTSRQLFGLRVLGLIAPAKGASPLRRIRGALLVIGLIIVLIGIGAGLVKLIALPGGGLGWPPAVLLGVILDAVVLATLAWFGRRRQRAARAKGVGGA